MGDPRVEPGLGRGEHAPGCGGYGAPRDAGMREAWGCLGGAAGCRGPGGYPRRARGLRDRMEQGYGGAGDPGAPFAGPYFAAAPVRGIPRGASCLASGFNTPRPGVPAAPHGGQGCGEVPRPEGFPWCLAARTPQPGIVTPPGLRSVAKISCTLLFSSLLWAKRCV